MFEGLFQPVHLLIVLGIMLLVFGPKRLPDLGKGMDGYSVGCRTRRRAGSRARRLRPGRNGLATITPGV